MPDVVRGAQLLAGLQPGMTERDCVQLLRWKGSPLSCHLMLTAGPRARYGPLSPGDRPLERGDPFDGRLRDPGCAQLPRRVPRRGSVGVARRRRGRRRTSAGRAGMAARRSAQLLRRLADVRPPQCSPSGRGRELASAIVDRRLGDSFGRLRDLALNPGHQDCTPRRVNSPRQKESGRPGSADIDKHVKELAFKSIDLKGEYSRMRTSEGSRAGNGRPWWRRSHDMAEVDRAEDPFLPCRPRYECVRLRSHS